MLALRLLLSLLGAHLLSELLLLCQPHPLCLEAPPVLRKGAASSQLCLTPPPSPPNSESWSWSPGHNGSGLIGSQSQSRCACLLKIHKGPGPQSIPAGNAKALFWLWLPQPAPGRGRETLSWGSTHLDTTHSWGSQTLSPQPGGAGVAGGQSCLGHRPAL